MYRTLLIATYHWWLIASTWIWFIFFLFGCWKSTPTAKTTTKSSWTCQSSLKLEDWLEKDFFKISLFVLKCKKASLWYFQQQQHKNRFYFRFYPFLFIFSCKKFFSSKKRSRNCNIVRMCVLLCKNCLIIQFTQL